MPNILVSGPAGAGKSDVARELRDEMDGPAVIADFQSLYAAISGDVRGPDGTFPMRDERLLPITEYVRRALISGAVSRQIGVVGTNSDGDPDRRAFLLEQLGEGSEEQVVDPGEDVVRSRLSNRRTGRISTACKAASDRWFRRLPRLLRGR